MADTPQLQTVFSVEDPKALSETDLTACTLLALAGVRYFSYAVLDEANRRFIDLKSYYFPSAAHLLPETAEQLFDQDKILYTSFRQAKIAFDTPRQTLVPAALYAADARREYLHLLYGEGGDEAVFADTLEEPGIVNVYAADRNMAGYLKKEFATEKIYHAQTALLKAALERQGIPVAPDEDFLLVQMQYQQLSVIVFAGGRLVCQQQLTCLAGADVAYHVLNMMRQWQLDPQQVKVFLCGGITADSEAYQELYRYIAHPGWMERPAGFQYIEKFSHYPAHYFYNLFALALCG